MVEGARSALHSLAESTQLKTKDTYLHLARECLKTMLNLKTINKKIQFDMKTI
ncbi:hypothetical protein PI124_g2708 [Phytophthora idaei]|nr:hypothetical protein PI125_g17415 [Phytophthora idaei]KAG3135040.1 hypothetical protein PI126_g18426 [Phytophthora idaei]KAG3252696.1 hypothetical protein PI124_g2708 [Phytophthora idaei]